tara:strand:+ start:14904 stop:15737 length:834 start_codon:yes stop_codon:yes gene_type:complete
MNLTNSVSAPAFNPKAEALEDKALIESYFNIQLDDKRDFRILGAVERLIQTHFRGERLPRCEKIRSDHYFNLLRFISVAMLYTDQAQNMVVAKSQRLDGKAYIVPAGNSFFMKKLGIERSTLDGIIATAKRLGWYISNVRFGYYQCGTGKRHYGKNSIKRVFIGLYDLFGMGKKVRDSVKKAVQYKQYRDKQEAAAALRTAKKNIELGEFHDFGYGVENQRRFNKGKEKRLSKATANRANHDALLAEQIELQAKGYSLEEIANHQAGTAIIDDNIPF